MSRMSEKIYEKGHNMKTLNEKIQHAIMFRPLGVSEKKHKQYIQQLIEQQVREIEEKKKTNP